VAQDAILRIPRNWTEAQDNILRHIFKGEEMSKRGSGILLHITSLPSAYGIGDFGPGAYQFADALAEGRQRFWQVLPLNPTSTALGNSPYSSYAAFAGNPLLISPDLLVAEGLLRESDVADHPPFSDAHVDYNAVSEYKGRILRLAYQNARRTLAVDAHFAQFCGRAAHWLEDYTLFVALKEHFQGEVWSDWPPEVRDRRDLALGEWRERLRDRILMEKFFQHLFFKQWFTLKAYCNGKKIRIIGDMPIYVSYDSSDVWANSQFFKLDEARRAAFVAGVPPDYFSPTGQLWGNPVYDWDRLQQTEYLWWVERVGHNLNLFDLVRFDHFRGFVAYWEVPAGEASAVNGRWIDVPGKDFFDTLFRKFPSLPIIAEDLGLITPDVRELINQLGFPPMKVLLFAFGDDLPTNPYAPHNYTQVCVAYTGTHDNNTIRGWFRKEAGPADRQRLFAYLGREVGEESVHWELIRLVMMSVADMVIIPMQDILGLDEASRMNLPATAKGNWGWRLQAEQLTPPLIERLAHMTYIYGRV
jgi:4-alpha-glucanotransferase